MVGKTDDTNAPLNAAQRPKSQLWKQILAFVLGIALLYFAFSGTDINKTLAYASNVNIFYLVVVCFTGLIAHLLRAVRWLIFLKPVAGRNVGLFHSFYAVIIGYAVNIVIPRGGEVARLVAINRLERIPIAGVLPTLLIDRLIDFVFLACLVGISLNLLPDSLLQALPAKMGWNLPPLVYRFACAIMLGASLLGLVLLPLTARIIGWLTSIDMVVKALPERVLIKLKELTADFEKGASCLNNPFNYPLIAFLSLLMWACYWLNYYLILFAFRLENQVSAKDALISFTIGSVGVLIPTPGSAGGVHLLVQKGLMLTCNLPPEQGLAVATVYHAMAFIIATCIPAAGCILIEMFLKRKKAGEAG